MKEDRDGWSKIDIVVKAIAGVALPAALFFIGQEVANRQQQTADENRMLERVNSLLKPLSSDSARERRLAMEVAGYLGKNKQLPLELFPVLLDAAKDDPSAGTAKAASAAVEQVAEASPDLRSQVTQSFSSAPARIYFHVSHESQREDAKALGAKLVESLGTGFVVPGVEKRRGPPRSELRFFKAAERGEAEQIAAKLKDLGVDAAVTDLSRNYEKSSEIRPRHFELWLGDEKLLR